jgi:23S rRNA pseudouridine2605 synthase
MRINQYLAHVLGVSRRDADKLVQKAYVEINGEIASLGDQVEDDTIVKYYQNEKWTELTKVSSKNDTTIMFYKPIFAITSKSDPEKRKTIYDYLPKQYHALKPAGRLDYMSEGLLIMSTDGELIHTLTHPSNNSSKLYIVGLKNELQTSMITQARNGMTIDDYKLESVKIEKVSKLMLTNHGYLKLERHLTWYSFELSEGRNNQIRKMCASWGYKVHRLIRVKQGEYEMTEKLYKSKIVKV